MEIGGTQLTPMTDGDRSSKPSRDIARVVEAFTKLHIAGDEELRGQEISQALEDAILNLNRDENVDVTGYMAWQEAVSLLQRINQEKASREVSVAPDAFKDNTVAELCDILGLLQFHSVSSAMAVPANFFGSQQTGVESMGFRDEKEDFMVNMDVDWDTVDLDVDVAAPESDVPNGEQHGSKDETVDYLCLLGSKGDSSTENRASGTELAKRSGEVQDDLFPPFESYIQPSYDSLLLPIENYDEYLPDSFDASMTDLLRFPN